MSRKEQGQQPKVLIPEIRLQTRVKELADQINHDYRDQELTLICTLKGSFVFFADLIRHIEVPITCEFLGLSSYGNQRVSSGEVKVTLDVNEPLQDRNVLVVEDIVDTGLTLKYILDALGARRPATLRVCALLMKPDSIKVPVEVDYVGFKIGSEFVVGYGVDLAEKLRGLPYIGFMENEH